MFCLDCQGSVRGYGHRERYRDRCGGPWKGGYALIMVYLKTCLYGKFSIRGVRTRLWKLPQTFPAQCPST